MYYIIFITYISECVFFLSFWSWTHVAALVFLGPKLDWLIIFTRSYPLKASGAMTLNTLQASTLFLNLLFFRPVRIAPFDLWFVVWRWSRVYEIELLKKIKTQLSFHWWNIRTISRRAWIYNFIPPTCFRSLSTKPHIPANLSTRNCRFRVVDRRERSICLIIAYLQLWTMFWSTRYP